MGVLGCLPVRYMQVHVGATSRRGNRANLKYMYGRSLKTTMQTKKIVF